MKMVKRNKGRGSTTELGVPENYKGNFEGVSYEVIKSGSKGNCVKIHDVMVDCGVPFKDIQDHLYDVKYLLITHSHSDHVKETTLNRIKKMFPKITIIGNYEINELFGVDIIANDGYPVVTMDYTFYPFEVKHDVLCYGFYWKTNFTERELTILYCTDAQDMPSFFQEEGIGIDMFFLESNHDVKKVQAASAGGKFGYNVALGARRHLNHDQAKLFYFMNRVSKESLWVELHRSERFY